MGPIRVQSLKLRQLLGPRVLNTKWLFLEWVLKSRINAIGRGPAWVGATAMPASFTKPSFP